jgi:hypothetical protein
MQKTHINLWRNDEGKDWTIVINDVRHDHVSSEVLKSLVEATVIAADRSLDEQHGDLHGRETTSELKPPRTKWVEIT